MSDAVNTTHLVLAESSLSVTTFQSPRYTGLALYSQYRHFLKCRCTVRSDQ